jgi:hypothetical protein
MNRRNFVKGVMAIAAGSAVARLAIALKRALRRSRPLPRL